MRRTRFHTMARVLDVSEDSVKKALSASWVQDDMFVPIKTITAAKREIMMRSFEKLTVPLYGNHRTRVSVAEMTHITGYVQNVTLRIWKSIRRKAIPQPVSSVKSGLESI